MAVKQYEWPFKENPHTLLIQEDDNRFSFAICDEASHVLVVPGQTPELVRKVGNTVLKSPLKLIEGH